MFMASFMLNLENEHIRLDTVSRVHTLQCVIHKIIYRFAKKSAFNIPNINSVTSVRFGKCTSEGNSIQALDGS